MHEGKQNEMASVFRWLNGGDSDKAGQREEAPLHPESHREFDDLLPQLRAYAEQKERRRLEKERTVAALVEQERNHQAQLADLRQQLERGMRDAVARNTATLQRAHEQTIDDLQQQHAAELEQQADQTIANLRQQLERDMQDAVARNTATLQRAHEQTIDDLQQQHAAELEQAEATRTQTIVNLRQQLAAAAREREASGLREAELRRDRTRAEEQLRPTISDTREAQIRAQVEAHTQTIRMLHDEVEDLRTAWRQSEERSLVLQRYLEQAASELQQQAGSILVLELDELCVRLRTESLYHEEALNLLQAHFTTLRGAKRPAPQDWGALLLESIAQRRRTAFSNLVPMVGYDQ